MLFLVEFVFQIKNLFTGDYLWTAPGISTDAEAFEDSLILLVKPAH